MFQVRFAPEIRRRIEERELDKDFVLAACQLIQTGHGTSWVRLNEEVRGVATVRTNSAVEKGQAVDWTQVGAILDFDLVEEDLDFGHFTVLHTGSSWATLFDFRSGRVKASMYLDGAEQFLEAARLAAAEKLTRPANDSLFSACELIAKAHLLVVSHRAALAKSHGPVGSAINQQARLGNIDNTFVAIYNAQSNVRPSARYIEGDVSLPEIGVFEAVQEQLMDLRVRLRIPKEAKTDL